MKITTELNSTIMNLLKYYLDYTFKDELLSNVSNKSFEAIKSMLLAEFDNIGLTDTDVKNVWKSWFDMAVMNGTLVPPMLSLPNHDELDVGNFIADLASAAIDKL